MLRLLAVLAAAALPGHPLLVHEPGLRVYGPPPSGNVPCAHLLPLPAHSLATVKRAVALATPKLLAKSKLDARDPQVKVGPASRSGYDVRAGGCGTTAWARSDVAFVRLPHVTFSASLSELVFAVGRVRDGWVLWAWIH